MADTTNHDGGTTYAGADTRAPASAGEIEQRRANKANHSERVTHGGKAGSGGKE